MYTKRKRLLYTKVLLITLLCICMMCGCTSKDKKVTNESNNPNTSFNTNQNVAVSKNSEELTNEDKNKEIKSDINTNLSSSQNSEELKKYIVNKGDTLYSICKKYESSCPTNVAVKTILKANNLSEADGLKEGMTLVIPDKYLSSGAIYTIKKGDTLFNIAKKFIPNATSNEGMKKILTDNFLTSDELNSGEQLFIPVSK